MPHISRAGVELRLVSAIQSSRGNDAGLCMYTYIDIYVYINRHIWWLIMTWWVWS